jgi:hypothetical protein
VKNKVVAGLNQSGSVARPTDVVLGKAAKPSASPGGGIGAISAFSPTQLRQLYGVNNISFGGITGNGAGETIAIVDAYDQPDLVDSTAANFNTSDLHLFDQQFGLPDPPSFQKLPETPGGTLPTTQESNWSIEESMDVEWAHAMAPDAGIDLVEANSSSVADLIDAAAVTAKNIPGVVTVAMSFTFNETAAETTTDAVFLSPPSQNVTFLAATGDAGAASTGYPAFSPNVVAVGGTTVYTDYNGDYQSETTWNDYHGATGGGPSTVERRPAYQADTAIAGSTRTVPDVSFDASPSSGVYVVDSAIPGTGTNYYKVGGTSLATPCWAALVAIADQGRQLQGLAPLDGATQTLPGLYDLPETDFHDITTGNNGFYSPGYSATPGYDMATGRGTPQAASLVPDLAGGATVSGIVTNQITGRPVAGQQLYLDLNNNGSFNADDPVATTNPAGFYQFTDQAGHETGTVRLLNSTGDIVTASAPLATAYGATDTVNLSLVPIGNSPAGYTLALDPTGSHMQLSAGGTVVQDMPAGGGDTIDFDLSQAGSSLTVNATNGNPLPAGGITVTGVAGAGNYLSLIGTPGNDTTAVSAASVVFDAVPIDFSNLGGIRLTPGTGVTALSVLSGSATVTAGPAGGGIATRVFSSIAVASDSFLAFATAAAHADRTLVLTSSLNVSAGGTLDLGGNDMIVIGGGGPTGSLSAVNALTDTGDNFGRWNGTGLASSAAADNTTHLTALGVATGSIVAGPFDGYTPAPADVIVKYTWLGDANLDGRVDGSDYSIIDAAYAGHATGWDNGDFNGDGTVDGSDYALIDNAFNNQGPQM